MGWLKLLKVLNGCKHSWNQFGRANAWKRIFQGIEGKEELDLWNPDCNLVILMSRCGEEIQGEIASVDCQSIAKGECGWSDHDRAEELKPFLIVAQYLSFLV